MALYSSIRSFNILYINLMIYNHAVPPSHPRIDLHSDVSFNNFLDEVLDSPGNCADKTGKRRGQSWNSVKVKDLEACKQNCSEYIRHMVTACRYSYTTSRCTYLKEEVSFGNGGTLDASCVFFGRKRPEGMEILSTKIKLL